MDQTKDQTARWRDRAKATPYVSPLQKLSSNRVYQEAKQKTFHCPVCLGRYLEQEERPKKLPCDHIICLLCYKNIKDEGVDHCPICQVQHKFIRSGISLDSDCDITNDSVSGFESSKSINLSENSFEMKKDQTNTLMETSHCHEHSFKILNLYCKVHDIRICFDCKHEKHSSNNCSVISCKQEMKGRKLKAEHCIDSKVHLMTKLNSRLTEFLGTLKKEDPKYSQHVEDKISAVNGLLEEVKVKQLFLSDTKRDVEKQETWENVISACGDAELKVLYIDNSLKDMYTKLEAIKLHFTVRQQIGYEENLININNEKLEEEEEECSSKSKPKPTENNGSYEQFPYNIQKNKHQITKEMGNEIIPKNTEENDGIDGFMSKIKHKKQLQIPNKRDNVNKGMSHETSVQLISITDSDTKKTNFLEDPTHKVNDSNKETIIKEHKPYNVRHEVDRLENITHIPNEMNQENKYKPLDNDNLSFHKAMNVKCVVTNNDVNSDMFGENVNNFKHENENNVTSYDIDKGPTNVTKETESETLLKKLLSDTKKQKDMKISEVNKLTICLFAMFILSIIFYFMFARENNLIKDDLTRALSQKKELENLIEDSLSEIRELQHKLDDTISQRDLFHLKLNEALIIHGREPEIHELPQIENETSSWYSWIGSLLYHSFYLTFRILMLTGSFTILSAGGEMLNEEYLSLPVSNDSVKRSISMVLCFLILYEVCGIVTWITNLQVVASPLFKWYQPGNLFIVDGIRTFFPWIFAHSGLMKWLSTAMVGIIVLALSIYIMSEISQSMKSRGVDKQNHDAFFIITWPILCFALSVFLVWLTFLPMM
ncbi:unnamed protein product [Meganyctiphanes norvegica]|uniref:RING-type domain-containing protein n=1 Tax=Meganyctiphanes norvegica TaxID=48144 RepID=A0AAV2RHR4_MEGNR